MLLFLFLCPVWFIPGNSAAIAIPKDNVTLSLLDVNSSKVQEASKITNLTIITEGGSTIQSSAPVTKTKQNHTVLLSLDSEFERDKSSNSKVVPRKGVVYPADSSMTAQNKSNLNRVAETHEKLTQSSLDKKISKQNVAPDNTVISNKTLAEQSTNEDNANKTTHKPKKPLVLSNEPLDRINFYDIDSKTPLLESSVKSYADDTASINKNEPVKKIQPMKSSRHPDMIMPIVITILVVPMFAVLGYMGLRRGQEAWKNRHYKRMDFLLDGMYNE